MSPHWRVFHAYVAQIALSKLPIFATREGSAPSAEASQKLASNANFRISQRGFFGARNGESEVRRTSVDTALCAVPTFVFAGAGRRWVYVVRARVSEAREGKIKVTLRCRVSRCLHIGSSEGVPDEPSRSAPSLCFPPILIPPLREPGSARRHPRREACA
jgi:hypothetical protein